MKTIPGFDPDKATEFVHSHRLWPFVKLAFFRDVEQVPMDSKEFLEEQERLMSEKRFLRMTDKQKTTGSWELEGKDSVFEPMYKSTLWSLMFLDYLGLNGTVVPEISKAVDWAFKKQYDWDKQMFHNEHGIWGEFMQCMSATTLRAMIRMGFADRKDVRDACLSHLDHIRGKEGLCHYKRGPTKKERMKWTCPWGLIKDLLFLSEWPESWRNEDHALSVAAIQEVILGHSLAKADYPRLADKPNRLWTMFGYFRNWSCSVFEGIEALVASGVSNHPVLDEALEFVGLRCVDGVTWRYDAVPSWWVKFETKSESPWLSIRGLKIWNALS